MTLSIAARTDWIIQQVLAEKLSVTDAVLQLQEFADVLRASKQEQSARTVERAIRKLTESSG